LFVPSIGCNTKIVNLFDRLKIVCYYFTGAESRNVNAILGIVVLRAMKKEVGRDFGLSPNIIM
jgi:hypothetical protein